MQDIPCTYRISVKALIRDGDKVLLVRERDGSWELPGGGLEHGEDPHAGLKREITEETGLTVVSIASGPAAFWTINKQVGSPVLTWFGFVAYETEVSGDFRPDQSDGGEAEKAGYFTVDEALALPLHDNTAPYFRP